MNLSRTANTQQEFSSNRKQPFCFLMKTCSYELIAGKIILRSVRCCWLQLHSCNLAACYCQSAKALLNPQVAINRGVLYALGFIDITAAQKRLYIDFGD